MNGFHARLCIQEICLPFHLLGISNQWKLVCYLYSIRDNITLGIGVVLGERSSERRYSGENIITTGPTAI